MCDLVITDIFLNDLILKCKIYVWQRIPNSTCTCQWMLLCTKPGIVKKYDPLLVMPFVSMEGAALTCDLLAYKKIYAKQ